MFVFLDFNLNIGTARIELIPDFIGYIFILQGLAELFDKSELFSKARPYAKGMAVYTAILFALDIFGAADMLGFVGFVLGLISTVISLYISYNIVMGVKDMETTFGMQLSGDGLKSNWNLLAVFTVAVYLLFFIPFLNILCIIAGLIIGIVFLVSFSKTKNLYYDQST